MFKDNNNNALFSEGNIQKCLSEKRKQQHRIGFMDTKFCYVCSSCDISVSILFPDNFLDIYLRKPIKNSSDICGERADM